MNFVFTQSSVVDIQRNVVKISRQNNNTLRTQHFVRSRTSWPISLLYFLSRGFARAVVVVMKLEMASENLWQRGFDEWGKRRKLLE